MQAVPLNRPNYLDSHPRFLQEALQNRHLSGGGPFTLRSEKQLSTLMRCPVLLTSSATHALEMMAILLDIKPGDEIILPSFTFVSTGNAFVLRGAVLRFADNDLYGNISVSHVEKLISKRTRAVVVIHYAGTSGDIVALQDLCKNHRISLLEDAAAALGGKFRNQLLGTFGDLACISFHDSKIVTSGEGGALILQNPQYHSRAKIIRDKGTNRSDLLLGLVDKYTWIDQGSSYEMSDLNAAYLYPQLLELDHIIEHRKTLWTQYQQELSGQLEQLGIQILSHPPESRPNYQQFALLCRNEQQRNHYISFMKQNGIHVSFHYQPLHLSPFGRQWGEGAVCPTAEWISSVIVRLPLFFNLTWHEQDQVISQTLQWKKEQQFDADHQIM